MSDPLYSKQKYLKLRGTSSRHFLSPIVKRCVITESASVQSSKSLSNVKLKGFDIRLERLSHKKLCVLLKQTSLDDAKCSDHTNYPQPVFKKYKRKSRKRTEKRRVKRREKRKKKEESEEGKETTESIVSSPKRKRTHPVRINVCVCVCVIDNHRRRRREMRFIRIS